MNVSSVHEFGLLHDVARVCAAVCVIHAIRLLLLVFCSRYSSGQSQPSHHNRNQFILHYYMYFLESFLSFNFFLLVNFPQAPVAISPFILFTPYAMPVESIPLHYKWLQVSE